MKPSYRFFFCCVLLLSVLKGWSKIVPANIEIESDRKLASSARTPHSQAMDVARRDLLESLQRLVAHENYYRSVYGKFTPHLGRVGYSIPSRVAQSYEVRVVEAGETKLLISAFQGAEAGSDKQSDLASIDQFYHLEANFTTPPPRAEFLKVQAEKHLRLVHDAQPGFTLSEEGVYKDYFRYEMRSDSHGKKVAVATGMRPPVLGVELDSDESAQGSAESEEILGDYASEDGGSTSLSSNALGQKSDSAVMSSSEEAFLAQQIFHGEVGRYARNWAELTKITNFNFDGKEIIPDADLIQAVGAGVDRQVAGASAGDSPVDSGLSSPPLEIEPISK